VTTELKLENLSLAIMLSAVFFVMFGGIVIRGFIHSILFNMTVVGSPLSANDKFTLFLKKNWFWVVPAIALCIGFIVADLSR